MNTSDNMIAIITARMGSSRLAGKVMLPLCGKSVLDHLIDRIENAGLFRQIVLATSQDPANEPLVQLALRRNIGIFQGEENDVLDRYVKILRQWNAENCARFCADNPLTDMETTARLVRMHLDNHLDYSCVKGLRLELGLVELFSRHALESEYAETSPSDEMRRESVGIFIRENASRFKVGTLKADPFLHLSPYRLTLDYQEDYEMLRRVFDSLYRGHPISYEEALRFLERNPEIASVNEAKVQKGANRYWQELDARLQ